MVQGFSGTGVIDRLSPSVARATFATKSQYKSMLEVQELANHLTPEELADETGLKQHDVIVKCVELGVPIFQGQDRQDALRRIAQGGHGSACRRLTGRYCNHHHGRSESVA